jgi:hypothetical protein
MSRRRLLDANRFAVRDALAIPTRTEACGLVKGGKPDENKKAKANEKKRQYEAHHLTASRIPIEPPHL